LEKEERVMSDDDNGTHRRIIPIPVKPMPGPAPLTSAVVPAASDDDGAPVTRGELRRELEPIRQRLDALRPGPSNAEKVGLVAFIPIMTIIAGVIAKLLGVEVSP
jgi:hypothetical protein